MHREKTIQKLTTAWLTVAVLACGSEAAPTKTSTKAAPSGTAGSSLVSGGGGTDSAGSGGSSAGAPPISTGSAGTGLVGIMGSGGGGGSDGIGQGGGGGSSSTGNPGIDCSQLPVHPATGATISDFENGTLTQEVVNGGAWFASNDGLGGVQTPDPLSPVEANLLSPPRESSTKGLHTTGKGFAVKGDGHWGGGIGANLVFAGNPSDPVDASAYKGITFYAKGAGVVHVQAQIPEVTGWCNSCGAKGQECFNEHSRDVTLTADWKQYTITWDQFTQENWGYRTSFQGGRRLQSIRFFSPGAVDWDFWIDDLAFAK